MADKLVTVAEYTDSIKADMARQVLEDFGIRAIVVGQNAGDGRIGVFESVKIQVFESDAAKATEVLESSEMEYNADEPEEFEDENMVEHDEPEEQGEQEEL